MSHQVHITSTAEHDIMRAADYIEFTLKNPDAADNLLDAATEQIGSLADLPQKFYIKKLKRYADRLYPVSLNSKYSPIKIKESDRLDVFGKVVG